jgi:hypothetical protein
MSVLKPRFRLRSPAYAFEKILYWLSEGGNSAGSETERIHNHFARRLIDQQNYAWIGISHVEGVHDAQTLIQTASQVGVYHHNIGIAAPQPSARR